MVAHSMTLSDPKSPYSSEANISHTVHTVAVNMMLCGFLSDS